MSLKAKLISLISTLLLLCSLLTVGVFAVKNTTFNVGGDIVFNVHGIEATIALTDPGLQNIVLPNNVIAGTNVMNPITINNEKTAQEILDQYEKWSNLDLSFAPDESTATIELVITNTTQDENNYIGISVTADALTKNNADISVVNNAGGSTAVIGKEESATFTITFSVIDDEYNASIEGFKVNFNMKKLDSADLPTEDEAIVVSNDENLGTVEYELIDNQLNIIPSPKEGAKFVGYKKVVESSSVNASTLSTNNDFTYLNTPTQGSIFLPYFAINMGFDMDTAVELSREFSSRIFMDYSAYTSNTNFVTMMQEMQDYLKNSDQKALDEAEMAYPGLVDSIKIVASGNPQITNYLDYSEGDKFIAVFTNGGEEITDSNGYTYQKFADVGFSMIKKFNLPDGGSTNLVLESYLGELPVIGFVQPSPNSSIFIFNDELTSVVVPDSYVVYPTSLFGGMSKLNSVTFGKGATSIPMDSFMQCTNLTEVIIPDSVTSIGAQAFMLCSSLSKIDLPNNLKVIAPAAFARTGLSSIIIPESTHLIADQAFNSCKSLTSITIGTGLTSIGLSAFTSCKALNTVNYRGTETQWNAITIKSDNSALTNATKVYNYAG